ncbi:hypothetical protein OBV_34210 [Oscillibacter valericigenes Sjm18-20]|nr:hypothetical protein OBV_34210 [Oscillibacter valericigenes Sjm18-20]
MGRPATPRLKSQAEGERRDEMPRFRIDPVQADTGRETMETIGRELGNLEDEAKSIRCGLRFQIRQQEQINNRLQEIEKRLQHQQKHAGNLAECMRAAVSCYQKSDQTVCGEYGVDGGAMDEYSWNFSQSGDGKYSFKTWESSKYDPDWMKGLAQDQMSPLFMSFLNPITTPYLSIYELYQLWQAAPKRSAGFRAEGEGMFGADYTVTGTAETFKTNTNVEASSSFEHNKDFGFQANVTATAALLAGSMSIECGLASGSVSGSVGTGAVYGEAVCALFQNGNFEPQLSVALGAHAEAITGQIEGQLGSDDVNVHVEGDGSVGVAKAEAKAAFSPEDGLSAKAEVGVAALSGTAKAGITVFGYNIDASFTGEVGAVGAGAEFVMNSEEIEVGGKLSVLAGLGLKLRISHST